MFLILRYVLLHKKNFMDRTDIHFDSLMSQDPFKSSLLFVALCSLSVVLIVIPTRYIALVGVLVRRRRALIAYR